MYGIRNASIPSNDLSLIAHSCALRSNCGCTCPKLQRSNCLKYLGVHIDHNLNFKYHISQLSTRTRKLIYVFKTLRHIADLDTLKMVYFAVCQTIFAYCISIWGGAPKSTLIKLEVAQRAILKVMTFSSFFFPTKELFSCCKVLTVRQLFIYNTIIRTHSSIAYNPSLHVNKRRHDIVCPGKVWNTGFAHRFFGFLGPYLYNICNQQTKLYPLNKFECKMKIYSWLLNQDYEKTENLLVILS